jgi:hypothetical protein
MTRAVVVEEKEKTGIEEVDIDEQVIGTPEEGPGKRNIMIMKTTILMKAVMMIDAMQEEEAEWIGVPEDQEIVDRVEEKKIIPTITMMTEGQDSRVRAPLNPLMKAALLP